jgi:hypothetical protein
MEVSNTRLLMVNFEHAVLVFCNRFENCAKRNESGADTFDSRSVTWSDSGVNRSRLSSAPFANKVKKHSCYGHRNHYILGIRLISRVREIGLLALILH